MQPGRVYLGFNSLQQTLLYSSLVPLCVASSSTHPALKLVNLLPSPYIGYAANQSICLTMLWLNVVWCTSPTWPHASIGPLRLGILAPGATCVHGHGWVDDDHIWPLVHRLTEPGDKITKVPALCGHNTGQRLSAWVSMTTHDFEGGHKYCGRVREWELWETFSREDK